MSLDEIAIGFIKVANEVMARPIRSLTEARGFRTSNHLLSAFGGAGGQHACELARNLGISKIIIHQYSSILSAYGVSDNPLAIDITQDADYSPKSRRWLSRTELTNNRSLARWSTTIQPAHRSCLESSD